MASVALGTKPVGSVVKLKENGIPVNYLVVHQGLPGIMYDASCNGTWLLRQEIAEDRMWKDETPNVLSSSGIHAYLNSIWVNRYDINIQSSIKQVKIPYNDGNGTSGTPSKDNTGSNGLVCKVFLLSSREVGWTTPNQYGAQFPEDGLVLTYFEGTQLEDPRRIAYFNGEAHDWWTRSPVIVTNYSVFRCYKNGFFSAGICSLFSGVRPALILPSTLWVSDDGSVTNNTAPTTPSNITIPSSISGGTSITVKWGASSDAQGNLAGYKVEKSINGGSSWSQIYQGSALQTTDNVAFGTESVMYRVKAYDTEGLESGYKTSNQVTVINNTAPSAPPSITVPLTVVGGGKLTVTWTASNDGEGNLAGYELERQVASGGWSQIFKGNALSFQDTITKGWASVQYRVRAYDAYNATSGYTTSEVRTVDNNTAPTITCDQGSGTDLGEKSSGFSISYTVNDADNDTVTVTESMDAATKRTFQPTLGQANQFQVTGTYFQQLLNGNHTMKMKAQDTGGKSAEHILTFTKSVTSCSITMEQPMEADAKITIMVMSAAGDIPADAEYQVLVTNNAKDAEPVWEDATSAIKSGANYLFTNETATNGFAFNFKLTASRGCSGIGGYISSIQGGFQ